jgi:hypothetical protein
MSILQPMRQSGWRLHLLRAKASLLLAVFLSAGTSLPSIDALAYHQDGAEGGKSQPHVDPAGGCASHADQCSLGRSASGSAAFAALSGGTRIELQSHPAQRQIPHFEPPCADLSAVPQPRAPPAFRSV